MGKWRDQASSYMSLIRAGQRGLNAVTVVHVGFCFFFFKDSYSFFSGQNCEGFDLT